MYAGKRESVIDYVSILVAQSSKGFSESGLLFWIIKSRHISSLGQVSLQLLFKHRKSFVQRLSERQFGSIYPDNLFCVVLCCLYLLTSSKYSGGFITSFRDIQSHSSHLLIIQLKLILLIALACAISRSSLLVGTASSF